MHALHDDHLGRMPRIGDAGLECAIVERYHLVADGLAVALLRFDWVVDDLDIAAAPGDRPAKRCGYAAAASCRIEAVLGGLVRRYRNAVAPQFPVPFALDQAPRRDSIVEYELVGIGEAEHLALGSHQRVALVEILTPEPRRPG